MCGIFGLVVGNDACTSDTDIARVIKALFLYSESRGKEAAGIAFATDAQINIERMAQPASAFIKSPIYRKALHRALSLAGSANGGRFAAIGHARLVTSGAQAINSNNQPIASGEVAAVHNGIVVNHEDLWRQHPGLTRFADVDTEVIVALLDMHTTNGLRPPQAAAEVFTSIVGEASIAALFGAGESMLLATNTGSLFVLSSDTSPITVFCSEVAIARRLQARFAGLLGASSIQQVHARRGLMIDLRSAHVSETFALEPHPPITVPTIPAEQVINGTGRQRRQLITSGDVIARRWQSMRRCSTCVLPATMPFIEFDADGVCNYCRNHHRQNLRGEEALLRLLDKYRSTTGSPDCLVGFSGGRDSSYGLHLMKTRYGMNPIAYTYDWGMVTDLARRNQSRLCGKLGVEHIWVSADIKAKRKNVQRNVEAWLKQPDLGMVPLFMAGDKQYMWHANRLMKETDLSLMVYSTNHYERTDFKVGFCGLPPVSAGIKLHHLNLSRKAKLAVYYLGRYLRNPRYFNGSLIDTMSAFLSYYFVRQDFLHIFDYVDWNEDEINKILEVEYEWEKATDTESTWRIGDGTAPFYNYIYRTIAGFSEYETFRSNQVREGVITRNEALMLVETENEMRLPSIQEYCNVIGVDFDRAIRIIDQVPKLY